MRRLASIVVTVATILTSTPAVAWTTPVVLDGAGGASGRVVGAIGSDTAAVRSGGVAHLFYSVGVEGRSVLRHAALGGSPTFETLDGVGGPNGRTTHDVGSDVSAAVFDGVLHVFYRDDTRGNLRHGWFDGVVWRFRALDGASTAGGRVDADVGRASAAATFKGSLVVAYLATKRADVRIASFDGARWRFATIDGNRTAGGRTTHQVGYNLQASVWGRELHVLYYERDPAYGEELGWVREARFDGARWRFRRAFRVNTIVPGKTLAVGVVAKDEVYVAYNTTLQGDPRLRWRVWDGIAWSTSSLLYEVLYGQVGASALFVVVDGLPSLVFSDQAGESIQYFMWTGGDVTSQSLWGYSGSPTSSLPSGASGVHVYLGDGHTPTEHSILLRTVGP